MSPAPRLRPGPGARGPALLAEAGSLLCLGGCSLPLWASWAIFCAASTCARG